MKKIYLIFCLFILSIADSYSQNNWIQTGAVWHYDYFTFTNGGAYKIVYESDTLINNLTFKKLTTYRNTCYANPPDSVAQLSYSPPSSFHTDFVRFMGDTLLDTLSAVLYNFDLQIGDSTKYYVVDSVYSKNINGINYRAQKVHSTDTTNCFGIIGEVVEKYGSNKFLFPFYYDPCCGNNSPTICDGIDQRFLNCYSDIQSNIILNTTHTCDYYFWTGLNSPQKSDEGITIYPNPSSNTIEIKGINKSWIIEISNSIGQVIISTQNATQIDISHLQKGYYFVKIAGSANIIFKPLLKVD